MKLLFENWRKFTESVENPELSGNCGMVAISIYEEAERRGLDPMLVFVHNADIESVIDGKLEGDDKNEIAYGAYDLYHVAVEIRDEYYDDRGKISREDLNFDDFGEEDEDYYVDKFYLNDTLRDAIKRNTNRDKCPADFEKRALEILDNGEGELTPDQKEFPERYGNCGMLALALIEEGIKRKTPGIEIAFVTATDEDEFLEADEPEIHHVAMWFNGKYYDDRGEISEDQLGDFSPLGLTSPEDAKPKEGRDYIVLTYEMENNEDLKLATDIVKNNTDWWKSCEEYIQRAEDFWENLSVGDLVEISMDAFYRSKQDADINFQTLRDIQAVIKKYYEIDGQRGRQPHYKTLTQEWDLEERARDIIRILQSPHGDADAYTTTHTSARPRREMVGMEGIEGLLSQMQNVQRQMESGNYRWPKFFANRAYNRAGDRTRTLFPEMKKWLHDPEKIIPYLINQLETAKRDLLNALKWIRKRIDIEEYVPPEGISDLQGLMDAGSVRGPEDDEN